MLDTYVKVHPHYKVLNSTAKEIILEIVHILKRRRNYESVVGDLWSHDFHFKSYTPEEIMIQRILWFEQVSNSFHFFCSLN